MRADTASDRALVGAALAGDRAAATQLLHRIAATVWIACRLLGSGEADAREAFSFALAALQAENFARLRAYDGRSRLESFVAILARDILAQRMLHAFWDDPSSGWAAFQRFFDADIERLVLRRLPGQQRQDLRRDAYQEVCLALIDNDYRRIRAYAGSGSFAGFVLHTVDRLLIDFMRSLGARRRLPAAAQLLSLSEIPEAAAPGLIEPSPEDIVLEQEADRLIALAAAVLRDLAARLPAPERLYLRIALGGAEPLPAREVARLMGCPVDEVYKLKQRVLKRLRDALWEHPAVKKWLASV